MSDSNGNVKTNSDDVTTDADRNRALYAGVQSLKQRLVKPNNGTSEVDGTKSPQPKCITPPREGVAVGILESVPTERDPNIVVASNKSVQDDPMQLCRESTSSTRARFKEMEKMAKSMDMGSTSYNKSKDAIAVDTKSLRNRFLAGQNGDADDSQKKMKKINPLEEIQQLCRRESTPATEVCENGDNENITEEDQANNNNVISRSRAEELKKKFINNSTNEHKKKEFKMELGEGGIFESEPKERNEQIVVSEYERDLGIISQGDNAQVQNVKSNLQKFKELQSQKAQPYQSRKTEPIKLDLDLSKSGVYENTPKESEADSQAAGNDDIDSSYLELIKDRKCAKEARKAFIDRQQQFQSLSENTQQKSPPKMINIWDDLCSYSGVFENQPKEQNKDIVRHNSNVSQSKETPPENVIDNSKTETSA